MIPSLNLDDNTPDYADFLLKKRIQALMAAVPSEAPEIPGPVHQPIGYREAIELPPVRPPVQPMMQAPPAESLAPAPPIEAPKAVAPIAPPEAQAPVPDVGKLPINTTTVSAPAAPQYEIPTQVKDLINRYETQYPHREDYQPSGWRKFLGTAAGIGTGVFGMSPLLGMAVGNAITNAPYRGAVQRFKEENVPYVEAAKKAEEQQKMVLDAAMTGARVGNLGAQATSSLAGANKALSEADFNRWKMQQKQRWVPATEEEFMREQAARNAGKPSHVNLLMSNGQEIPNAVQQPDGSYLVGDKPLDLKAGLEIIDARPSDRVMTPGQQVLWDYRKAHPGVKIPDDVYQMAMGTTGLDVLKTQLETLKLKSETRKEGKFDPANVKKGAWTVALSPEKFHDTQYIPAEMGNDVGNSFMEMTAGLLPPPNKLDPKMAHGVDANRIATNHLKRIKGLLDQDPTLYDRMGPLLGRMARGEEILGTDIMGGLTDKQQQLVQQIRTQLSYFKVQEMAAASGMGRPTNYIAGILNGSVADPHMDRNKFQGALRGALESAQQNMLAAAQAQFGSRGKVYDPKSKRDVPRLDWDEQGNPMIYLEKYQGYVPLKQ